MGRNAGFAAAVNRGIVEASHPLVAILNTDVELAPDYLEKLAAADAPFATGKILNPAGLLDGTFDLTCRGATTWRCGAGHPDAPPFDQPRDIASPPWTAVLYRAEVFRQVGLLEESFESYLEDVDFGLRCAAQGIAGRYVPEARAVHLGSAAWAAGIRKPCAASRAISSFLQPATIPPATCGRSWSRSSSGAALALRHGRGLAWVRGKFQGLRRFSVRSRSIPSERSGSYSTSCCDRMNSSSGPPVEDMYWKLYFLLTGGAK